LELEQLRMFDETCRWDYVVYLDEPVGAIPPGTTLVADMPDPKP
jgi:hypothetical protein